MHKNYPLDNASATSPRSWVYSLKHPKLLIETQNLLLRLPELSDIPEILRYFTENAEHLMPFDPQRPEKFFTEEYWKDRIPKHHELFAHDQEVRFYVFAKDKLQVIGTIGISQIVRSAFQACNLGYGIAKSFEGKGLMFEAVSGAINFAFVELNLHRVMANHVPENERSAKLLNRLGFVREGLAVDYLRINGVWRDHVLNSLTNKNWIGR